MLFFLSSDEYTDVYFREYSISLMLFGTEIFLIWTHMWEAQKCHHDPWCSYSMTQPLFFLGILFLLTFTLITAMLRKFLHFRWCQNDSQKMVVQLENFCFYTWWFFFGQSNWSFFYLTCSCLFVKTFQKSHFVKTLDIQHTAKLKFIEEKTESRTKRKNFVLNWKYFLLSFRGNVR